MKNKKKNGGFNKIKLLMMMLVLIGGLLVATKLVQTNQGNRSKAMYVTEIGSTALYGVGNTCGTNGKCINTTLPSGAVCNIGGTNNGKIVIGLCPGGSNIRCCMPSTTIIGPTAVPTKPALGQKCGNNGLCIKTTLSIGSVCRINSSRTGKVTSGFCSGDNTIRCCQ